MNNNYKTVSGKRFRGCQVIPELVQARNNANKGIALIAGLALGGAAWAQSVETSDEVMLSGGAILVPPGSQGGTWSIPSTQLDVGYNPLRNGALEIKNGGSVSSAGTVIGTSQGSIGTVTVDGMGSSWTTNGSNLIVGHSGDGTLNINAGGSVFSGYGTIGYNSGGVGTVTVNGPGSSWAITHGGQLEVGYSGNAILNVWNGGRVSSAVGYIGSGSGSMGTVKVDGVGSSWTVNELYVGIAGNATLNIQNRGGVYSDYLVIGSTSSGNGTLNLNTGGVLQTSFISHGAGTAAINFNGGILRASKSQSDFLQGFTANSVTINSNGAYIDTQNYAVGITTRDIFSGSGALTKQGSGTLTIAGGNSWGGNTTVSAGTLTLESYTQTSGQTLGIGVSSDVSYGKLNVSGTATFNAGAHLIVDVSDANVLSKNQTWTGIVTAGSLNASSFNVPDNSALFNFIPMIRGNSIDLAVVTSGSGSGTDSTGITLHHSVLDNGLFPAQGAATVLDAQVQGTPSGDMSNVVTALGRLPDQGSLARAAAQTLPVNFSSQAIMNTLFLVNHLVSGRLESTASVTSGLSTGEAETDKHLWIKPFGSHARQNDENGASGFSSNTWGMAVGAEGEWDTARLGLAYAYANIHVDGNTALSGTGQNARINSNILAFYGSRPVNGLTLDFQADVGWSDNSSRRALSFGGLNRIASGSYGTWSAHVGTGLSKTFPLSQDMAFIPGVQIDYTRLRSHSYSETGAGALNLDVNANTVRALVLGGDAQLVGNLGEQSKFSVRLGIGYDTINDAGDIVAAYAGVPGQNFVASGLAHSPWILTAGLGYTYHTGNGTNIALRYDRQGRNGFLNQSASLNAFWRF